MWGLMCSQEPTEKINLHMFFQFMICQPSLCTFNCDILHYLFLMQIEKLLVDRQCDSLNPGNWADGPLHCFDLVLNKYFRPPSPLEPKPS